MLSYNDWLVQEGKVKLYELYLSGPGITPQADKAVHAVRGVVSDPKSFLVIKFRGTKEDVRKVEEAVAKFSWKVVDSEIERE